MAGQLRARIRSTWALAPVALVAVIAVALAGGGSAAPAASTTPSAAKASDHPNIVFVLTDDLSWNLLKYMPNVGDMQQDGETFSRYFVTDSLCCPSRSSIFSGACRTTQACSRTRRPTAASACSTTAARRATPSRPPSAESGADYRTAMMGKYLNGYQPCTSRRYVPPGWSEWDVAGNGYSEFNYNLNENGKLVHYGHSPSDYLTDVLADKGVGFINPRRQGGEPVPARDRDVRAARALHARAAGREATSPA